MNDFDQEGPVPDSFCELLDSMDGPDRLDMTPEQKARIDRKVHAAIAAQNRRFAWVRRGKWALSVSAAIAAACCGGALVFAHGEVAPRENRSGIEAAGHDTVVRAGDPETATGPAVSAGTESAAPGPSGAAPRRRRHRRHP